MRQHTFARCWKKASSGPFLFSLLLLASADLLAQPAGLEGRIVYSKVVDQPDEFTPGTTEVHLIDPDGSGDHTIWTGPQATIDVFPAVGWRPDGAEITLASAHESHCSAFEADLFGLAPDGSTQRRITNSPDCAGQLTFPQGSVEIPIERTDGGSSTFFEVYIQGAQSRQEINLSTNTSTTVTIHNVADFGSGVEQEVWIHGFETFFIPNPLIFFVPWINLQTVASARRAGCDLFVVGSAIFKQDDYTAAIASLDKAIGEAL